MDGGIPTRYTEPLNKGDLRSILESLVDLPQNRDVRDRILALLTADYIEPTPYTYSAIYIAAAGGAANGIAAGVVDAPFNVNIQADADFLVLNQTYDANSLNAAASVSATPKPNVRVLITNTGSGYAFMDARVPVAAIFGNGQFPYILPQPQFLSAKATLQILATNFDAAAGYNLQLCFNGVKLKAYDQR